MIEPLNFACCYHPTTVVFIDDNQSFLDSILFELNENISTRSFTDPEKAMVYLQNHALPNFSDKYLKSLKNNESFEGVGSDNVEHSYIDIELFNLHKEIYNPERFNTVIVVVVDYTMPGMNGLELCRNLKGLPFKFILITGDATLEDAVRAFNSGLIHQFIPKGVSDFTQQLENTIFTLQENQFVEYSSFLTKSLVANQSKWLSDSYFLTFLKDFYRKNNISEYYLVNESGCFLLLDAGGNSSWLVIKSEEEMQCYTNIAIDNCADKQIIKDLKSRTKILFLSTEAEHVNVSVDNWDKRLHPAKKLIGKDSTYYYAHVKEIIANPVKKDKITSYDSFLAKR